MPFKSKAQRRKFAQLLVEGKITDEQYEEWNRSTGRKELPERVADLGKGTKTRATKKRATGTGARKKPAARKSSTGKIATRASTKHPARRKSTR